MKNIKLIVSIYLTIGLASVATSQVRQANGSNLGAAANSSAFLDASSTASWNSSSNIGKGMIFPRVSLSTLTSFSASGTIGLANNYPTYFDGFVVYNIDISGVAGIGATSGTLSPGYWYYDNKTSTLGGGTWRKVGVGASPDSTTSSNGLTMTGKDVRLGGTLTGATTVTTSAANTLALTGLQSGASSDSILVVNPTTGVIARKSPTAITTTNTMSSSVNTMTNTTNGVVATAPIVNSVANAFNTTTRELTTTINGVAGTAVVLTDGADSTTSSNGLTMTGKDVRLGGTLTGATTVTTSAANTLALAGLQSGASSDSILVVNPTTGVIARKSPTAITTTNTLTNPTNTITSTVNGVSVTAPAVNTVANAFNATTRELTTTINGVAGTAVVLTDRADSTTSSNGLTLTGKDVRLGGALTGATTVTTSAANTLALAGLQSGASSDSIVVANPTTGVLARRSPTAFVAAATTNTLTGTGSALTSTVNGVVSTLSPSTGTIASGNTLGFDASGNLVKGLGNSPDSTTSSNGLTMTGKDVRLGGTLTGATTVTTSAANTLALAGLQSGASSDSILVVNPTTGVIARKSPTAITTTNTLTNPTNTITSTVNGVSVTAPAVNTVANAFNATTRELTTTINGVAGTAVVLTDGADSTTSSNGLTTTGKDIRLGGTLTGATTVTTSAANTLALAGLQSGASSDSILVVNPTTGVIARKSPTAITTTNTMSSSVNTMTNTTNGVVATAPIVNSVANAFNTTTRELTTTINGVAGTAVVLTDRADSTTSSNGLTMTGKDVRLGGTLTGATTVTTSAANTLALAGLQSGASSDSIVVANPTTGVLARRSPTAFIAAATTNTLTGTGSVLTSTVNGVVSTLTPSTGTIASGNTLGFDASGNLVKGLGASSDSTTSSNGLTMTGKDVRLGGTLTGATTVTTSAANTLAISGLQAANATDSIVMVVPATGVLKTIAPKTLMDNVALNVSTQTGNYTALPTDDILIFNGTTGGLILTLPTSGIPIGKKIYVVNISNNDWQVTPTLLSGGVTSCQGTVGTLLMYVGLGWTTINSF